MNIAFLHSSRSSGQAYSRNENHSIDGNPKTCTRSPKNADYTWYEVQVPYDKKIGSVLLYLDKGKLL